MNSSETITLYPFQQQAVEKIQAVMLENSSCKLLYQLPTGGGKTMIFSQLAKNYIERTGKKVVILTHRIELSQQTTQVLEKQKISVVLLHSKLKILPKADCWVAMIETLNNRLSEEKIDLSDFGLVIIDEAHYNYFRKIFKFFHHCAWVGFTATPISSNVHLPLYKDYEKIIVGENIGQLITDGYLTPAVTYTFDVDLKSLKIGIHGDFTIQSSENLYGSHWMLTKLWDAYQECAVGKKTLIFNSSIRISQWVLHFFKEKNCTNIRHLDSTVSDKERQEILAWFRKTPGAILTSVGILTTGFDEPSIEVIMLNRATRSIALYHQMVGRGSRIFPDKKQFLIVDLGNNARRFGFWEDTLDWEKIFKNPSWFLDEYLSQEQNDWDYNEYERPVELTEKLKHQPENSELSIKELYKIANQKHQKSSVVIDQAIENHWHWIRLNSQNLTDALELLELFKDEIEYRVRLYGKYVNATSSYLTWLIENYEKKLKKIIISHFKDEDED